MMAFSAAARRAVAAATSASSRVGRRAAAPAVRALSANAGTFLENFAVDRFDDHTMKEVLDPATLAAFEGGSGVGGARGGGGGGSGRS